MPTAHINQWKHNRGFLGLIDPKFPDWAVTVTFYTALHAVDALLKHDKVGGIVSHDTRNRTLMQTHRYMQIWKHYQPLYGLSRTVRYMAKPESWVPWDQVEAQIIKRYLKSIEDSVQKLMDINQNLPPVTMRTLTAPVSQSSGNSTVPGGGHA